MSIIAYRDGIIAADTLTTAGQTRVGHNPKIARNSHGDLAGAVGGLAFCENFLVWFRNGEKGERPKATSDGDGHTDMGIIFRRDGTIVEIGSDGEFPASRAEFYAIGCADDVALGAMYAGASAADAVRAAIALNVHCGGEVETLAHDGASRPWRRSHMEPWLLGEHSVG